MRSGSFENNSSYLQNYYKSYIYIYIYIYIYMIKEDLALNNPQGLDCHETQQGLTNKLIVLLKLHLI